MPTTLTYGLKSTCLLDSAEVIELRPREQPTLAGDALVAAVRAQLDEPLNYASLSQATIPGDRIVLAIEPAIPQQLAVAVVDGALRALREAGAEEGCVTILTSSPLANGEMHAEQLKAELADLGHAHCHVQTHNPDNEKQGAFLGVTQAGRALRLNRYLCDADFVLPIGITRAQHRTSGAPTSFGGLYPAFSDREAIDRFSAATAEHGTSASDEGWRELEECGCLLGVGMTLQVVPSRGGQVAAVLAGQPQSVAQQAASKYCQTWGCETELRGDLVIATLTGDASQQTWQNLGRAVAAAEAVLAPGGAIAICSELADPPGRGLGQLIGNEDAMVVEREILRNPSADSGPALRLCRALQRGAIYLRSQIPPSVVESLGMTPLESENELERLAQTLRPCLVLEEAQWLLPATVSFANGSFTTGDSEVGDTEIGKTEAVRTETRSA